MSVLIPNTRVGIRRRAAPTFDAHGFPVGGGYGAPSASYPGLVRERGDGGWTLSVDDRLWPVREHDILVEPLPGGRSWLVVTADLLRNDVDPLVNYVRCEARERKGDSTEPGGPEFAAR